MFNTVGKVGGTLERVSILKPDGRTVDYYPHRKNKVTNSGLYFLLQGAIAGYNGGDGDRFNLFKSSTSNKGGLVICKIGNGTTPTTYDDTDMESSLYSTEARPTFSSGARGTMHGVRFTVNGTVATQEMIVTHQFSSAPTSYTLSEVGYFGMVGSVQRMFSHLVLEEPISVSQGDIVYTYYYFRASKDCAVAYGSTNGINFAIRPMATCEDFSSSTHSNWQDIVNSSFYYYGPNSGYEAGLGYGGSNFDNFGILMPSNNNAVSWSDKLAGTFGLYTSNKEFPATVLHTKEIWGVPNIFSRYAYQGEKATTSKSYANNSDTSYYTVTFNGNVTGTIHAAIIHGLMIRFGHMEEDVWVPEPITKTNTQSLKFEYSSTIIRE